METSDHVQQTSQNRANAVTEADILSKIKGAIPASTEKTTTWAVKIWDSMLVNQQRQGAEIPLHLENIDNEQFNY